MERLDCYQLAQVDLARYAGVVVPPLVDQEHLARHRGVIEAFLDIGGVVVFGGHLHRDWLPGASVFTPLEAPRLGDYKVSFVSDHPVFRGVDAADLTFRRGVAGFFARGHHPPPEGAEVLTRLAGGQPTTYVDQTSTAGTILVQASWDLLGYPAGLGTTSARIPGQLLDLTVTAAHRPTPRLTRPESRAASTGAAR